MNVTGYVLRRSLGFSWIDEHSKVFRNECYRTYRWALIVPVFRRRICKGPFHEMRYVGHSHTILISSLRALLLAVILGVSFGCSVRAAIAIQLEDLPTPRPRWITRAK